MEQAVRVILLLYAGGFSCFAGYRQRQIMTALGGIVAGAALGFVLARLLKLEILWWGVGFAAILGVTLGILGFKLHKQGTFLLCGGCAMLLVYHVLQIGVLGPLAPWIVWVAAAAAGLLVGWLVYQVYRPAVILTTSIFGGMLLAWTVFGLLSQAHPVQRFGWCVGLLTGILGAVFQFRTTRR